MKGDLSFNKVVKAPVGIEHIEIATVVSMALKILPTHVQWQLLGQILVIMQCHICRKLDLKQGMCMLVWAQVIVAACGDWI